MVSVASWIVLALTFAINILAVDIGPSAIRFFDDWRCHNEVKAHGLSDTVIIKGSVSELAIPGARKDDKDTYSYTGNIPTSAGPPGGIPYDQVTVQFNYYSLEPQTVGLVSVSWPFVRTLWTTSISMLIYPRANVSEYRRPLSLRLSMHILAMNTDRQYRLSLYFFLIYVVPSSCPS